MIMNNENKKLPRKRERIDRNTKRRNERKIEMDDKMKLSLNKIKTEKKKIKILIKLKN